MHRARQMRVRNAETLQRLIEHRIAAVRIVIGNDPMQMRHMHKRLTQARQFSDLFSTRIRWRHKVDDGRLGGGWSWSAAVCR